MQLREDAYLFIGSMDVSPERERLFHEIYDTEHARHLAEVPGVHWIRRYTLQPFSVRIGTDLVPFPFADEPRFTAVYSLQGPEVLTSREWGKAVERGRWATEVRPFTSRRRHVLLRPNRPASSG